MAVDVDELITELKAVVLEETQVQIADDELQKRAGIYATGSDQDKFHYACGLIQHADKSNKEKGVQLLRGKFYGIPLNSEALYTAIQKTSKYFSDADKDLARACLYYIAVGYFAMKNFKSAKDYGKILLDVTPNHQNCKALLALIEDEEHPQHHADSTKDKKKGGIFSSFNKKKDKDVEKKDKKEKEKEEKKEKDDKKKKTDDKKDVDKDDKKGKDKKDDKKVEPKTPGKEKTKKSEEDGDGDSDDKKDDSESKDKDDTEDGKEKSSEDAKESDKEGGDSSDKDDEESS